MDPRGITVALLEDHPLMRDAVCAALRLSGIVVTASHSDPRSFLAAIAERPPQVAIIDMKLDESGPELAGLPVLRHLKAFHPQVRVLVLSAVRDSRLMSECLAAGACGFLEKRVTLGADLVPAVLAALQGELPAALTSPSPDPRLPLKQLTPREREVLGLLAAGADNLKIATLLGIRERTVKAHVQELYRKLGTENRVQLALLARDYGLAFGDPR